MSVLRCNFLLNLISPRIHLAIKNFMNQIQFYREIQGVLEEEKEELELLVPGKKEAKNAFLLPTEELYSSFLESQNRYLEKLSSAIKTWLIPLRQSVYDRKPLVSREEMFFFQKIHTLYDAQNMLVCLLCLNFSF